jgi:protein TonB
VQAARLVYRVEPRYTPVLRSIGLQGTVVLHAIIQRDGTIGELRVDSGHALLAQEATRAVSQWRYRPTLLNGTPVEVETIITVVFKLSQ